MLVLSSRADLDRLIEQTGTAASVCVPTMGALHAGHAALIEQGARLARDCALNGGAVVTIFVNPTQFNDPRDFERYPKTLDADLALCKAAGAAAVFVPAVTDVYPPAETVPAGTLPEVATRPGLEDAARPGHFAGVCQVVRRLFNLVRPRAAIFGEKDWQQLQVVAAMTRADASGIDIIPGPTVRDPDGLAMSSRNRFLSAADRARALAIPRALAAAGAEPDWQRAQSVLRSTLHAAGIQPDYAVVREARSLVGPPGVPCAPGAGRMVVAAPVGPVRLLDNAPWPPIEP